jgi:hypothetical protein
MLGHLTTHFVHSFMQYPWRKRQIGREGVHIASKIKSLMQIL